MTEPVAIMIVDRRRKPKPLIRRLPRIVATSAVLFGPGLIADSAAMQWAGFLCFMVLVVTGIALTIPKQMTIAEARAKLDALERAGEVTP